MKWCTVPMRVTVRLTKMMVTVTTSLLLLHCLFLISYFNHFQWDPPTGQGHYHSVTHGQRIWPNQKLVFSMPNVNRRYTLCFCPKQHDTVNHEDVVTVIQDIRIST